MEPTKSQKTKRNFSRKNSSRRFKAPQTFKKSDGTTYSFKELPYKARRQIIDDSQNNTLDNQINSVINNLPSDVKRQYLKEKKIQRTYSQFEQVVDRIILDHVNSVYLLTKNNQQNLVVYVDNSLIAAELNARREFIKFKYQEQFNIEIVDFEIRISRGQYLNNYPFKKDRTNTSSISNVNVSNQNSQDLPSPCELSLEENQEINSLLTHVEDLELRESFKKVLKAKKCRKSNFPEK